MSETQNDYNEKDAICCCPICDYFKTLWANTTWMTCETQVELAPNDFSRIVERMGGDPPAKITEDECIQDLSSLSDREYLCGAYWMFKQIFKIDHPILVELSLAKNREDMARILRDHGL